MVLINCPECGMEISNEADACSNCGYPLHPVIITQREKEKFKWKNDTKFSSKSLMIGSAGLLVLDIIIIIVISSMLKSHYELNRCIQSGCTKAKFMDGYCEEHYELHKEVEPDLSGCEANEHDREFGICGVCGEEIDLEWAKELAQSLSDAIKCESKALNGFNNMKSYSDARKAIEETIPALKEWKDELNHAEELCGNIKELEDLKNCLHSCSRSIPTSCGSYSDADVNKFLKQLENALFSSPDIYYKAAVLYGVYDSIDPPDESILSETEE